MRTLKPTPHRNALALAALLVVPLDDARAARPASESPFVAPSPQIVQPDIVVERFLQAVDRGELVVYGRVIDRSMILPVRVEYVYTLPTHATQVKVYATLKEPLPVPGRRGCKVEALGSVLEAGRIVEIESHLWMGE